MTRTFRNNPSPYKKCLRHPQTKNYLQQMVGVVDELEEFGFTPSNRERSLANKDNHLSVYDDVFISALSEDKRWKNDLEERESNQLPEYATCGYEWPQNENEARDIGRKMAENEEYFSHNLWIFCLPYELFEVLLEEIV